MKKYLIISKMFVAMDVSDDFGNWWLWRPNEKGDCFISGNDESEIHFKTFAARFQKKGEEWEFEQVDIDDFPNMVSFPGTTEIIELDPEESEENEEPKDKPDLKVVKQNEEENHNERG